MAVRSMLSRLEATMHHANGYFCYSYHEDWFGFRTEFCVSMTCTPEAIQTCENILAEHGR